MVKVWGSHDMLSTMLLPFLQEAMPHLMMTTIYNYTIQQTAPGIALDVAFVLAGDGRAWLSTSTAHRCRAAVGFHQSSMSESTVAGKKPQKTATWREKNMPKYPKISLKKKTSWCLKMGYTGIPFQTIENGRFFARGAVLLGDTRGNSCYALQYAMSTCAKSRIESACGLAGRFPDVFVTAVASALGLKHWQLHHFTTGSKVGLLW